MAVEFFGGLGSMLGDLASIKIPRYSGWNIYVKRKEDVAQKPDDWWKKFKEASKAGMESVINGLGISVEKSEEDWIDIANFDSFVSLNGNYDSQIVENVVEEGSFRSCNKINKPSIFTIELGKGGTSQEIESVLYNLKKYKNGTTLCRLTTPFGVIDNINLTKLAYSFTRDSGSNLLVATLTFQKIEQAYVAEMDTFVVGKLGNPSNADTKSTGKLALEVR